MKFYLILPGSSPYDLYHFFLFPQAMYGSACFPIALSTGKALKLCNSCGRDRRETAPRCSFHFISLVMTEVEHFFINLRIIFFFW